MCVRVNSHLFNVTNISLRKVFKKTLRSKNFKARENSGPKSLVNPYRQIPETISKKRAVTQGISRKLFPDFYQILQFWGMSQGIFRKLFPGKFYEYLPMKKYFFPKTGHDSEAFPETFSNIWKKFPEILLGHYPNLRNFKFHLKS